MRDPLPVEISSLAARHIRELEAWWRRNRTSAPNAVREELQRILRVIRVTPFAGQRATDVELPDVRRIHITRIWYFLYYDVKDDPERIELLALWSDSRGEGPPI
jgi:plasmid stabilization system protein ParE